jgi:hypothetical protein
MYTSKFQQHRANAGINDVLALKRHYYNGLTDTIKDEIAKADKPLDVQSLIDMATRINSRSYERAIERKGITTYQYNRNNTGRREPRKDQDGDTRMHNARISTDRKLG